MRSRAIREGSVGLLILVGLGLFTFLVIWLRGFRLGSRTYSFTTTFRDAGGMQVGSAVRYRGVVVGRVKAVQATSIEAEVEIEIRPATLNIPRESIILTNQTGLIGEATIDILPPAQGSTEVATNPLANDCPDSGIICAGDRVEGQVGATFNELIAATITLADLFSDEDLFANIKSLTGNSAVAAAEVARLADEVSVIAESVQSEVGPLLRSFSTTSTQIGQTANQAGLTLSEVNRLLASNRGSIVGTLENLNQASSDVRVIVNRITPLVEEQGLVENLQILSENAAQASVNASEASASLRNLTDSLATDENLLLLQETLDSARATFQNVQKITADLDELTGDPEVRDSLRELIRSLGSLLSSAEDLQQQTAIARSLAPAEAALLAQRSAQSASPQSASTQPSPAPSATSRPSTDLADPPAETPAPNPATPRPRTLIR